MFMKHQVTRAYVAKKPAAWTTCSLHFPHGQMYCKDKKLEKKSQTLADILFDPKSAEIFTVKLLVI